MITKSDFLTYLDAPRHLWALKNNKIEETNKNAYILHLFEQGQEVERLAEEYIKGFLLPQYHTDKGHFLRQPTGNDGDFQARTDLLVQNMDTGKWDMFEIKSSTQVEKRHIQDVTFQTLVFQKTHELGKIYVLHVNGDYVRNGELNLKELFVPTDVTEKVEAEKDNVHNMRYEALVVSREENCETTHECLKPKSCPCLAICHPDLPEYSIYDVNRLTSNVTKIRQLVEMGIKDVMQIPADFPLTETQRSQVQIAQNGKTEIETDLIRSDLQGLEYPLHFIDYESFNPAIPMYNGYKPYDQMPFQWSLYILREPNTELEHYEHIEMNKCDPIPTFISDLQKVIDSRGSIIVWNKTFEGGQNKRMGEIHPSIANFCENMNNRMYDLMDIFRKQWYAHPSFKGSFSLKNVLPILVPTLTYGDLEIAEGATAMAQWEKAVYGDGQDADKIKSSLLKYCGLDTLAMVKILEAVQLAIN